MLEILLAAGVKILTPVVLAAAGWAGTELARLIRRKVDNELLEGALISLNDAVFTVVDDLNQRLVSNAKEAADDGKLTNEEIKKFKGYALAEVKGLLSAKTLKDLAKAYDLDEAGIGNLIKKKVEQAVGARKGTASANVKSQMEQLLRDKGYIK